MASALAINNSLTASLIPLLAGMYLVKDLFLKKRHPGCLPYVLAAGTINTLIYVIGFRHFYRIGLAFTVNTGILILFSMFYTYSMLQASRKQLRKVFRINNISCCAVIILTSLSDLLIRVTLPGFDVGVLPGFWLLLVMMVITNLSALPAPAASLERKLS